MTLHMHYYMYSKSCKLADLYFTEIHHFTEILAVNHLKYKMDYFILIVSMCIQ